jgi:hypothetical protein
MFAAGCLNLWLLAHPGTEEEDVIDWFLGLDKATQAALAISIASPLVIAVVAVLGFWITYRTSTAANREIANITKSAKLNELRHLSKLRAADYRMKWIAAFRREAASLLKVQYEISFLKKKKSAERTQQEQDRLRELYYESSELKARLLMRIKQNSDDQNELRLEKLLRRSVSSDSDKAQDVRKEIRELVRAILKTEWNRIKSEIGSIIET